MPEKLPIRGARELAVRYGLRQVILAAWDGARTHVVTYGATSDDCDQAAQGGEMIKRVMGWPNWEAPPPRVKKLKLQIERLEAELDRLRT